MYHLTRRLFQLTAILLIAFACVFSPACKEDPVKAKLRHLEKGKQFLKEKKYREARLEFRNALIIDKNLADGFFGLSEASMGLNNVQEAFESLNQTVQLDPKNLEAKVRLGNLYLLNTREVANLNEADKLAKEVLDADPKNIEGYILRAGVWTAKQKWSEAEQDLKQAIAINPNRIESHLSYGRYFDQRAKSEASLPEKTKLNAEAEKTFNQALAIDSKSSLAHLALADFLFSRQRLNEAETQLKLAVEADPNDRIGLAAIARFYETQKNFGEAEKYLTRLAEITGDKNEGRAQVIDLHARDGKLDQAINEYQELIKQSPKYARAYVQLAGLLLRKNDFTSAAKQVDAALKLNKQETDALLMRGRINLVNGKTREAIADLEQVLKNEPKLSTGLYFMAEARLQDGDPERARMNISDMLKYYPDNPAGLLMMVRILLSQSGKPDTNEAIKISDKIINGVGFLKSNAAALQASRLEPETLSDIESKGYAARAVAKIQAKDFAGAQSDLEKAIQVDPNNPEPRGNLAGLLLAKNDASRARQIADQTLALNPTGESTIANVINVYLTQNDFPAAQQRIDALIAAQPYKKAFLMDQKVRVYVAQKDKENVEKTLRQILEVDPNYLPAYFELFAFYKSEQKMDQAMNELQQVVNRRPDDPRKMAQALLLLGMMEEERSRYDEAIKNYEKSINFDSRTPSASIALNNLAWVIADKGKGNLDKAAEYARSAIQLVPSVASFYDTLGYVLHQKKLYGLAIDQYLKAIERRPNEAAFQKHIAKSYQENNDKLRALQAYDKALKLVNPGSPDADMIKSEIAKLR